MTQNFSIVIPIYNEELYLRVQIKKLIKKIRELHLPSQYEIILVENGSIDETLKKARQIERYYKQVKVTTLDAPSYGQAFKIGIQEASYPIVFQFDLDFWDVGFLKKSLVLLQKYDLIIGSKNLSKSSDERGIGRKCVSMLIEYILRVRFGSTITDTHGLKAYKRDLILPFMDSIQSPNHFFDSELLIRCEKSGYRIKELPVKLSELRESRFPFLVRSRDAVMEFAFLLIPAWLRMPDMSFGIRFLKILNKTLSPVYALFI